MKSLTMDYGANYHLTADSDNTACPSPYRGTKEIIIGNGKTLPITHSMSSFVLANYFSLDNILYFHSIYYKILFIDAFTKQNKMFMEFFRDAFVVKDIPAK